MVDQSNKNKTIFLGVAAAAAVVGAALLWHFFSEGGGDEDSQIMRELKEANLDEVKKTPDGMLDPQYLLRLLNFVAKTSRKRRDDERNEALERRLEFYKEGKNDEYRALVKEQFEKDDEMCQVVMKEMLNLLDTTEAEFAGTMQVMAQQPQFQQFLMAAQQGKLPDENDQPKADEAPKLSKQKTLDAFELTKQHTIDALSKQADMQKKAMTGQVNEMDLMIDMFVEQAKLDDELYMKKGIRNDDLERAIMFYIGNGDNDVKKAMTQYMIQMQSEMRKAGGGGGMGMGMGM